MKRLTLLFLTIASLCFSQSPEAFKYQAVLRDNNGNLISDKNVSIQISILQNDIGGESVYSEKHSIKTNAFGAVNLEIGKGTQVSGIFIQIDWGLSSYFVKIEMDIDGDNVYENLGTSQLLSVPYALYAKQSGDEKWKENDNNIHYTKGNIGIGTDSPAEALHINGSIRGNQNGAVRVNTQFGYVDVGPKNVDYAHFYTNMPYGFYFGGSVTVRDHLIGYRESDLHLSTQSNSNFLPVKRISILNANGNVGVGTTNPLYKLDVNGTLNATSILINGQPLPSNGIWSLSSTNAYYNNGNVGIGTSNPLYKLDVNGTLNATSILINGQPLPSNGVWSLSGTNAHYNNGNVGIGTSTPAEKLHINGSIRGNQSGAIRVSTDFGYVDVGPKNADYAHFYTNMPYGFYFGGSVTVREHLIGYKDFDLYLSTQSTLDFQPVKRIAILNSNGNVGIGTTAPKSKLQVENGDIYLNTIGSGVIMKSPNGQCWKMTVSDSGAPVFTSITCPQ